MSETVPRAELRVLATERAQPDGRDELPPAPRGHGRRSLRESLRAGLSPWHAALAAVVAWSTVLNFNDLRQNGYANTFYSAAVKSDLLSLHNMLFVSFDPGGLITVDKPPLGVWAQIVSAKLFGFSPLSLLAPEAFAGVLAVIVMYFVIAPRFGRGAGVMSALALAVFPSFVAVSRDNGPDPILLLLMLCACWAALRAIDGGRMRWLLASAFLVGLAFNTKTLAALLVVPGIALGYFVCGRRTVGRRTLRLVGAGVLMVVVCASWITMVDLTPAGHRPYVGGSSDNSEFDLTFGYNGFGRVGGQNGGPGQVRIVSPSALLAPEIDLRPEYSIYNPAPHGGSGTQHGGSTAQHSGSTSQHGGSTAQHGGSTAQHGGSTSQHGGSTSQHSGSTSQHSGTTSQHSGSTSQHSGTATSTAAGASTGPSPSTSATHTTTSLTSSPAFHAQPTLHSVAPVSSPTTGVQAVPSVGRAAHPNAFGGPTGVLRLLGVSLGGQDGWLLPFAVLSLLAIALTVRGRRDPRLAVLLIMGGWFTVEGVILSWSSGIVHPYYVSALGPGVAALVGAGAYAMSDLAQRMDWRLAIGPLAAALTALVELMLLRREHYLRWFLPLLALALVVGVGLLLLRRRAAAGAMVFMLGTLLVAPAAYAATTWQVPVDGTFPAAGPHIPAGTGGYGVNGGGLIANIDLVRWIRAHDPGKRFALLTVAADTAAPLWLMGLPTADMGGYSGVDPALTGGAVAHLVQTGQARFVLLGGAYADRGGNAASRAVDDACVHVPTVLWRGIPGGPYADVSLFDCAGDETGLREAPP